MNNKDLPEWIINGRFIKGFLKEKENRIKHLIWLGKKLNYKKPIDWYKVSRKEFRDNYCEAMINNYYSGSYRLAIQDLHPEYEFLEWLFEHQRNIWEDKNIRKKFARWIGEPKRLNIKTKEDWYKIKQSDLRKHNICNGFWRKYNNSIPDCLINALPELDLKRWKFGQVPDHYWEIDSNRIDFVQTFLKKYNIVSPEDLRLLVENKRERTSKGYFIRRKGLSFLIRKEGGFGYFLYHKSNLINICKEFFPSYGWDNISFPLQPTGFIQNQNIKKPNYWKEEENRRNFVENLSITLNINNEEEWYFVNSQIIQNNSGGGLLRNYYQNDHITLLINNVKNFQLSAWKFIDKPRGFWNKEDNITNCIHGVYEDFKMDKLDDFYDFGIMQLAEYVKGRTLTNKFSNSMFKICKFVYKDFEWEESKFRAETNLLTTRKEKERYLKKTEKDLRISNNHDWYKQSVVKVNKKSTYGKKLLKKYNGSLISMLEDLIPSEKWKPWIFNRVSRSYWCDENNQKKAISWLMEEKLNIQIEDAHLVTQDDLINFGLSSLLNHYDYSLLKLFSNLFEEISFDSTLFNKTGTGEKKLYQYLIELFPSKKIEWGMFYKKLRFKDSKRPMQLDFFFPDLLVAIEYQGEQHYRLAWGDEKTLEKLQKRDQEKRIACKNYGIELIEIRDIFWDKTKQSLLDLLQTTSLYDLLLESD